MKEGDIILAELSQSDGKTKLRPVLLLKQLPRYYDFLVCGISTQLNHFIQNFDELIGKSDNNFIQTGLRQSSIIRLSYLAVVPKHAIPGSIGSIETAIHKNLLERLAKYLLA